MTDRIDHAAEARKILERYKTVGLHTAEATAAQAHATLALVEQQRIANLIALGQFSHPISDSEVLMTAPKSAEKLLDEVRKRLEV